MVDPSALTVTAAFDPSLLPRLGERRSVLGAVRLRADELRSAPLGGQMALRLGDAVQRRTMDGAKPGQRAAVTAPWRTRPGRAPNSRGEPGRPERPRRRVGDLVCDRRLHRRRCATCRAFAADNATRSPGRETLGPGAARHNPGRRVRGPAGARVALQRTSHESRTRCSGFGTFARLALLGTTGDAHRRTSRAPS